MLTMWVTEGEHRRLLERCDGRPLAAWMRQTCLDEKPARTGKLPSLSPALLRQLAGMGNNLNQIARRVNAGESEGSFPVRAGFSSRQVCRIHAASGLPSQRSSSRRCSPSVTHMVSILFRFSDKPAS